MEVGNWITLGAVIVALVIGVASILHTRSMQKKERKERLLNEIIEWAIDLLEAIYGQDRSIITMKENKLKKMSIYHGFIQLKNRSLYIYRISKIFGTRLSRLVANAIIIIESTLQTHQEWINCKKEEEAQKKQEVINKATEVQKVALPIIEEASRIKIENI